MFQPSSLAFEGRASQDSADAAEYVSRKAAGGGASEDVLVTIVDNWADNDPYSTAKWLSALPAEPVTNKAVSHFVKMAWKADPENVLPWATLISDESLRNSVTRNVLREWSSVDNEGAFRWTKSPAASSFPPNVTGIVHPKQ